MRTSSRYAFCDTGTYSGYVLVIHSYCVRIKRIMLRAIGLILILWYLSVLFTESFRAFDEATSATFNAIESAATVAERNFK
jgi:hypothetical protein